MVGHAARAGAVTLLLLLGAAACGGDDDTNGTTHGDPADGEGVSPGAGSPGDDGDDGGGDGSGAEGSISDACSLLEVSEIEAELGDLGAVSDGELLGSSCTWEIGDPAGSSSGLVSIYSAVGSPSAEEALADAREVADDPVDVEGVGDEALLDGETLWFRAGDRFNSVSVHFGSGDVAGIEEKLTTLAQRMLDRI